MMEIKIIKEKLEKLIKLDKDFSILVQVSHWIYNKSKAYRGRDTNFEEKIK
mgnify:CR=1 FL=1